MHFQTAFLSFALFLLLFFLLFLSCFVSSFACSLAIKELIQIASNKLFSENYKDKHNNKAKYGWYRYDTRFAIPKYDNDGELAGYNIFRGRLVIRHAEDGKLYLYDVLRIKKETSEPLE